MAVNKFLDNVTRTVQVSLAVLNLDLKSLKNETEDTESGLIILRQSGSELDKVTDSLKNCGQWA